MGIGDVREFMAKRGRSGYAGRRWGNVLMVTGGLMLGAVFIVRAWSANESESGLDAFEKARTGSAVHSEGRVASVPRAARPDRPAFDVPQPDYSLWSEKRIEEYESSLRESEDLPDAVLHIDHLDIRVPVYNGADEFNLNRGVARIIGTGRFDFGGNLGIAGHRDGFFRGLKDIRVGDSFSVETLGGGAEFEVTSIRIVDPSEVSVLAPTETPSVTLVTCYPFYFVGNAPKRYIVRAEILNHPVNS